MIERIVQIKASDYDAIMEKANMNDAKIRELAEEYYQERGVFRIDIISKIENFRSGDIYSSVYSFENGLGKESPFKEIVSSDFRDKLAKKTRNHVEELFRENYGEFFTARKMLFKKLDHLQLVKLVCYTIAFSGWGVVMALFIYLFAK